MSSGKESESESLTLCDAMGLYSPWNYPGQNTGVGSLSLLQGIFPTQGLNPGLLHCRWILYQLSHRESPRILEWVAYTFSSRSSQARTQNGVSCTNWSIREAHPMDELVNKWCIYIYTGFPGGARGRRPRQETKETHRFNPWVRKIPWKRKWQLTPLFLPGKPHGRGAWWATVPGVTKSKTQLSKWTCHTYM